MKTLKLNDLNYINKDRFSLVNINDRFILKYDGENFVIDSETLFDKCNIYSRDILKIKINFDNNNNSHKYFTNIMRIFYDIISEIVLESDDINISHIINPIYSRESKKMLFVILNSKTQIKNIETNEIVKHSDLYDKVFNIYPIFYSPNINISSDKIYINFTFHTIIIDSLDSLDEKEIDEISLDYDKIKKIMKK